MIAPEGKAREGEEEEEDSPPQLGAEPKKTIPKPEFTMLTIVSLGPVYTGLGMVFFGSALRCGGESSSSSPSRALPSGTIVSAAGRGCQTQVASRQ